MKDLYLQIEELLLQALTRVSNSFTGTEVGEVQHFIDVGEYRLAFETFVAIVEEESKKIPKDALVPIIEAAAKMKMDEKTIEKKLIGHVIDL